MNRNSTIAIGVALAAWCATPAVHAEFDCSDRDCDELMQVVGLTQEPDPIGFASSLSDLLEGPDVSPGMSPGIFGSPGPAHVVLHPGTRNPVAVWAHHTGMHHDVAFVEWVDGAWGAPVFLSYTFADDVDPRITVDPLGGVHVTWWQRAREQVLLVSRLPGSTRWGSPWVIAHGARRPSIAAAGAELLLSYERDAGAGQQIVVRTLSPAGPPTIEVIADTERVEALDARVHAADEHVWIDWKNAPHNVGYSERHCGVWDAEPMTAEAVGTSDWAVEAARREVRRQITGD